MLLYHKMFQYQRPKLLPNLAMQEQKNECLAGQIGDYIDQLGGDPDWTVEMYHHNYDQLLNTIRLPEHLSACCVTVCEVKDNHVVLNGEQSFHWSKLMRKNFEPEDWTAQTCDMAASGITWIFTHGIELVDGGLSEKQLREFKRTYGARALRKLMKDSTRIISTIWSMDGPRFTMIGNPASLEGEFDVVGALTHNFDITKKYAHREVSWNELIFDSLEYPIFIDNYAMPHLAYEHKTFGQCDLYEFDKKQAPVIRLAGGTDIEG